MDREIYKGGMLTTESPARPTTLRVSGTLWVLLRSHAHRVINEQVENGVRSPVEETHPPKGVMSTLTAPNGASEDGRFPLQWRKEPVTVPL